MKCLSLVRGVVYVNDDIVEERKNYLANEIAEIPMLIRTFPNDICEVWHGSEYELIADGVISCVIGDIKADTPNLIIPQDLVCKTLLEELKKVDISENLRENYRIKMAEKNPNFINPDTVYVKEVDIA